MIRSPALGLYLEKQRRQRLWRSRLTGSRAGLGYLLRPDPVVRG